MTELVTLGTWIKRFLLEYLVAERSLAVNTRKSYRDTFTLLLPFVSARLRKPVELLTAEDLAFRHVLAFLDHLETDRGCSIQTRNQRLTAIRAFAHYVAGRDVTLVAWSTEIHVIPMKKALQPQTFWVTAEVESPRGISPRGARRTVRDSLPSYGSCPPATDLGQQFLPFPVDHRRVVSTRGLASDTGSSHCWLAAVLGRRAGPLRSRPITGPSSLLRARPPLCPASVLNRSRGLRLRVSLRIGTTGSHVPCRSLQESPATFMPGAVRAINRHLPNSSRGHSPFPGFDAA